MNIVQHIEEKFKNCAQIELTYDEWVAIRDKLVLYKKEIDRLIWSIQEHD